MSNNPGNTVTMIAETDVCIYTTCGVQCLAAGEEVTVSKQHAAHLREGFTVRATEKLADIRWLITIGPGETYTAEVPMVDGTPSMLAITAAASLALVTGTASKPLIVAEGAEIKESAPKLLESGKHSVSLTDGLEAVTDIAIVNCADVETKVQLEWTGVRA